MLYRLGDLITLCDDANEDLAYGLESLRGISIQKEFITSKANMNGVSLRPYKLVKPGSFAYVTVTSRNSNKITIALNDTSTTFIVSSSYVVFSVSNTRVLDTRYLYMFFNRASFDRYARFNSWGSARETFSWDDMCDTEIDLPAIEIQKKYADVYDALRSNHNTYSQGQEDIRLAYEAKLEQLLRDGERKPLASFITRHDIRNRNNEIRNVKGVSTAKSFREPTSKVDRNNLANYKIVRPGWFSFVQTTHNEKCFAFAYNDTDQDIVVTSVNEVFSVDEERILPEYLAAIFRRREFDRYARFHSWGSARETFTWTDLQEVEIPIPELEVQRCIAALYRVYRQRIEISERLKIQLKDICPLLIKESTSEAKR